MRHGAAPTPGRGADVGWIGIADAADSRFIATGTDSGGALSRGTLMLETRLTPERTPQTLLRLPCGAPWPGEVAVQVLPGGGIALTDSRAGPPWQIELPHDPECRTDILRISYGWDMAAGRGRLTLERPETNTAYSVPVSPAPPLSRRDMARLFDAPYGHYLHPEVDFLALSDRVEPVGPMPGLAADVPIATPSGPVRADTLRRGDLVLTAAGELVPVLHSVRRTVPARGSFRPVQIRAPYFRLEGDITLAPQQRLVFGGPEVEYLFGREAVLVPARHLVNGVSARFADTSSLVSYHHILLPGHEAVLAAGCPVESLYIGRLRRKPAQLSASVLSGTDRSRLPEHAQPMCPVLRPFEAITLAMHRAA